MFWIFITQTQAGEGSVNKFNSRFVMFLRCVWTEFFGGWLSRFIFIVVSIKLRRSVAEKETREKREKRWKKSPKSSEKLYFIDFNIFWGCCDAARRLSWVWSFVVRWALEATPWAEIFETMKFYYKEKKKLSRGFETFELSLSFSYSNPFWLLKWFPFKPRKKLLFIIVNSIAQLLSMSEISSWWKLRNSILVSLRKLQILYSLFSKNDQQQATIKVTI